MWVKICANTNLEDALQAAELGADAVGFVFAPSVRRVGVEQVKAITERLPRGIERVGVFAGSDATDIASAVELAGLDTVQLHGGIDLDTACALRERGFSVIHTVHWVLGEDDASEARVREQLGLVAAGERVLIDAKVGAASGGLGVRFDWARARSVLGEFAGPRLIVAGGLRPENVAEAIAELLPFGVDVASGVESSPGRKSLEKVREFIENARRA